MHTASAGAEHLHATHTDERVLEMTETRGRRRFAPPVDVVLAFVTWLVSVPVAYAVVRAFDLDPFSVGGALLPIGVGAAVAAVLIALALRRASDALAGVTTGLLAGWMGLCMAQALNGTPFPYGPIGGDEGRLLAQAMKSMTDGGSADAFVRGMPSEYPALYPWVLGQLADLVGRPPWKLAGDFQVLVMTGTIIAGYLLWRRFVGARTAFLIVALFTSTTAQPAKDYEFLAAMVTVPWILATFPVLPRGRGRMHWLPAGVIGGMLVSTYSAYFVFSAIGILAMIVLGVRELERRRGYLLHLLGVFVAAFVTASWYVVPFVWSSITDGGNRVSDFYLAQDLVRTPIYLHFTDLNVRGVLQLVGVIGIVWYRRQSWWARPFLLVVLSAYAYRILFLLRTSWDNHTGYLQYTTRMLDAVLVTAGILTLVEALPGLVARLPRHTGRLRELAVLGVVVVVGWSAIGGWNQWTPGPKGVRDVYLVLGGTNWATAAHAEPLPSGAKPRFFPPGTKASYFPTNGVKAFVEEQLGPEARPVVLSYEQRLFVFEPYYGYLPPDRIAANTLHRWDDRMAVLQKLAAITDPGRFAEAAADTEFGPIDAFVLKVKGDRWEFVNKKTQPRLSFSPESFSKGFAVRRLASDTVVAVRLP